MHSMVCKLSTGAACVHSFLAPAPQRRAGTSAHMSDAHAHPSHPTPPVQAQPTRVRSWLVSASAARKTSAEESWKRVATSTASTRCSRSEGASVGRRHNAESAHQHICSRGGSLEVGSCFNRQHPLL